MLKAKSAFLIIFILTFCGCKNEDSGKLTIGFSQCTTDDAWRQEMNQSMLRELEFHPELNLIIKDAQSDNTKQINQIQEFIDQKVDLLIVSPNEASPITPAVEMAYHKGIPVIIVDRRTSSELYTAYVGANNYDIGKLAGEYMKNLLNEDSRILELWGLKGSSPAIDRHNGFREVLNDSIRIISIEGNWDIGVAQKNLLNVLDSLPEIELVFAHNDVMAFGAFEIFQEKYPKNNIKFIGIDGLAGPEAGLQWVYDGVLKATFLYPTGGEEAIQIASKILNGEPFDKENSLPSTVIDDKNVRMMKLQADKLISQQTDIERQQQRIKEQAKIYYNQRTMLYILMASLIVAILLGALALFSLRANKEANRNLKSKNIEIQEQRDQIQVMADRAKEATQAKFQFFTNISHEFRTPLTLIMGPLDEIINHQKVLPEAKSDALMIRKNAGRLLRLVNQLMDFRKIENNKMKVQASENNVIQFVREIMNAFEKTAKSRGIDFRLISDQTSLAVWFDRDKLDKVIFNLLSNAFKFTKDDGLIHVLIQDEDNQTKLQVVDNGRGMSPEHVEHAFDRFYTGENYRTIGTGLGLSLTKELIMLQKGSISVRSKKGIGTTFEIILKNGNNHFSEDQIIFEKPEVIIPTAEHEVERYDQLNEEPEIKNPGLEYNILIIEDNNDLRSFLAKSLGANYQIEEASEGTSGLMKAYEEIPDLIICDVMLPGLSGIEITKRLKTDIKTAHIPVIILTARGSLDQKIEGVQTGADAYITKPFHLAFLKEQIRNLIKSREQLREHYLLELPNEPGREVTPGRLNKKFINDFLSLVEENISNPDLNANQISEALGLSRVQVYRKVKALLGYSVNEYVTSARLKKARHLLLSTDMNIAEVAYEVGFSSPAYFSTTFKSKYKCSPKEIRAKSVEDSV